MTKPLIGFAAFPLNTFTSDAVIEQVAGILRAKNLQAAELMCLANVLGKPRGGLPGYPSQERAKKIGAYLKDFHLSLHGPYVISLTTTDKKQLQASRAHMTRCLRLADGVGATHVTFHPGSRRGGQATFLRVEERLRQIMKKADEDGIMAVPAPEVAGKIASFGGFDEICLVAGKAGCLFCWDFAHDFARGGDVTTEQGILRRLELIEKNIDLSRWRLPVHLSGIVTSRRGEVRHAPLDGGNNTPWELFLSVLREQNFLNKVTIICESKSEERNNVNFRVEEALKLKAFIESRRIEKAYRSAQPSLSEFFEKTNE